MSKYLRKYEPCDGFTKISSLGDGDLKSTEFGIITLKQGDEHKAEGVEKEIALIVLGGKCSVKGEGFDFAGIGERTDVFSGKPSTVYLPSGMGYTVNADTDVEVAWAASPSTFKTDPYVITPEQVIKKHIGKESYQRDAHLMLTDEFPSDHFFIGEAFVPSGCHASYPPHRHDTDNMPVEVDMEEIYFFRFKPEQGYGIQKIYTDDRSIDFTCTVEQNSTTLIPKGYHPVINAPGYTMYYLWIMTGLKHRKFISVLDPKHKWIVEQ